MKKNLTLFISLLISFFTFSQENKESELAQIHRELDNPLAKRWSLVFQENYSINEGANLENNTSSNVLFFQPALPIPFGNNLVFTARPVFPLVTQPDFNSNLSGDDKITGFGDIQLASLFGPGNAAGWVWGMGITMVFPTATNPILGQEKWQAGPTVMLFHLAKKWNKGLFIQHWNSYAGNETRNDISTTDIQYVIRRNFGRQSIGMGPTVRINWYEEPENRLTFPIGLGYTRTVKIGNTPYKIRFEPQYSIIRPDNYASVWNFRLQIAPVIKSPFYN